MIHIPENCSTMETVERQQIRLLLQGLYGQGKTFSALTAPNPCVLNLDNNLGAHAGRKDVINVPFYDKKFIAKYNQQGLVTSAVTDWILKQGSKLSEEQTLTIDGLTNLNNAYDREVGVPMSTRTGKPDTQQWWGEKLDWQKEFFESLKSLKCDVIVCCHEQFERNDEGGLSGKILPLVQGSFKDQIGTHFTDIFRQHALPKMDLTKLSAEDKTKLLLNYGMKSEQEFMAFQSQFTTNTLYVWQMHPDGMATCKTHIKGGPKFCKASWNIFSSSTK